MADAGAIRAGQTYVEISADDAKLKSGLASAQQRLQGWAASTANTLSVNVGSVGGFSLDRITGGAIHVAAYAKTAAAVIHLASAAVEAHNGHWMALHKTLGEMPLGIGHAYDAFIELAGVITGATEAIKDLEKEAAGIAKFQRGVAWIRETEAQVGFELQQQKRSPEQQQMAAIDRKAAKAQALLDEAVNRGFPEYQVLPLRAMIEARRQGERGEIQGKIDIAARDRIIKEVGAWEDSLFSLGQELAKARGEIDALGAAEAEAKRKLTKELLDGTITSQEYSDRLADLARVYDELALAEEGRKADVDREKARAEAESLKASLMTPEEKGKARIEELKGMVLDDETRRRAIQKALSDAAGAAVNAPEMRGASRGMYGAENAWMLGGASGVQEQQLSAIKDVAKNTAKIAQLAADWGVAEFAP